MALCVDGFNLEKTVWEFVHQKFIYPLYFLKVPPTGKYLRVTLLERLTWTVCVLSLFQLRILSCFSHYEVKKKEIIRSLLLKVCFAKAKCFVFSHGEMGTLCEMAVLLPEGVCRMCAVVVFIRNSLALR